MAENQIDVYVVISKFRRKSIAPLLQEGLAARVGSQVRSRCPATEGAHSQYQSMLALLENRGNNLSDLESTQAIDCNNVLQLVLGCLEERDGHAVALPDIVYQDSNVEATNDLGELLIIGVVVLGEVHGVNLDIKVLAMVFLLQLLGERLELGFGSGN